MSVLKEVFNHLVLPPQLPGKQDANVESTGDDIVVRLVHATDTLSRLAGHEQTSPWHAIRQYLHRYQFLHIHGRLEKLSLTSKLRNFDQEQPLLLHVAEQNAALIVRYHASAQIEAVVFEAFEISPPSAEVLASEGALICDFPDCSAQIPLLEFQKPSFQHALADFLEKGSMEPLRCFQAFVTKSQTPIVESRDTGSPRLITHLLIPLLESIGSSVDESVPRLRKRVRDDAVIEAAELPWRRLPLWMAIRVGIQRQLQLLLGSEVGRVYYKFLIITVLVELLRDCPGELAPELTMMLQAKVCRRLAKLEQQKNKTLEVHSKLSDTTAAFFEESIKQVTQLVSLAWEKFKRDTTRPVPLLPARADGQAQFLSLPNSEPYLQSVLHSYRAQKRTLPSLQLPSLHGTTIEQVELFTDKYHQLAELEGRIERKEEPQLTEDLTPDSSCERLARAILGLVDSVGAAYESDPEQMSIFILSLFRLWKCGGFVIFSAIFAAGARNASIRRQAYRNDRTLLIDPNSPLFKQVATLFRHFEDPHKITVFQPANSRGRLSVELRHLALSFFVNRKGLLQCRELDEEIDPDQDAGTLYGLESKIVLRDVVNSRRRSVIMPLGPLSSIRRGMHVVVRAAGGTDFAKFGIDDVLGRLSCPLEPRLLYAKAQFHAYTSFVIPDSLTGRTGTEEALHMLRSGQCQPWEPLGGAAVATLQTIADLSPKREYYPQHKQALQAISWNTRLTMTIQHDAYEGLVQNILDKSDCLRLFVQNAAEDSISVYEPSHLRKRGVTRRRLYERLFDGTNRTAASDRMYKSRGQEPDSEQARNVYYIASLFRKRPFRIDTRRELSAILQDWQLIGGFHEGRQADAASLSDLVDMSIDEQWGRLVNLCRHSNLDEPYNLMFRLSVMSLNPRNDPDVMKILAAFASLPKLRNSIPPSCPSFSQFKFNELPDIRSIFRVISVDLPEKHQKMQNKAEARHRKACEAEGKRLAQHFLNQWPDRKVSLNRFDSDLLDVGLAMERVVPEWERLHSNLLLSAYVSDVQDVLKDYEGGSGTSRPKAWRWDQEPFPGTSYDPVVPSISKDLLSRPLAASFGHQACELLLPKNSKLASHMEGSAKPRMPAKEIVELRQILSDLAQSSNPLRQHYGLDLKMSLDALERTSNQTQVPHATPNISDNARRTQELHAIVATHLSRIREALARDDNCSSWLRLGNLWPCTTSIALLEQLRSSSCCEFGNFVQETIVAHGILITKLQRLTRIHNALCHDKGKDLQAELGNSGHENWSALEWPDWLLLEIDSDILIRREQVDVAHAIIASESRKNTVLQLNMGKGKTSCIVPMALAAIGDGKQLSRLIVPKPLLLPTAQMIQSRLGGLVGREIRHIPFSRKTNINPQILQLYRNLHQEMLDSQGVVLIAPEHLLSYKLSGLQHLANSNLETAREVLEYHTYLSSIARDILDESDVSLAVKTQLIYPSGKQTTVDGHPHRWKVAQSMLSLVKDHLPKLEQDFPRNIEVLKRGQGYPIIYILHADVEEDLHRRIVDDICTGRTSFLRFTGCASDGCSPDIRRVLLGKILDMMLLERVARQFTDETIARKTLLLIRGLLHHRILLLCLRKRWNVQYGLHPTRDPMAVPFEAKGIPSEQAEFGHPDAAILLTCLAFYYTGLSLVQFREALRHILASHDPASEYDRWTSSCDSLPEALHHWNVINSDDQDQMEELWRHLRTNTIALDHYMNHFVFPAHAKQFDTELQASGWDLPLFPRTDSDKTLTRARTTGFSGTSDNKTMLPLTIQQSDLPSLHQTNAEVLTYLLQERNRGYHTVAHAGRRLSETEFLGQLRDKKIRVLIDAGAYILEMSNEDLVKTWMDIDTQPQAAVYFGTDNRAWVRYRGTKARVPLLATPLVDHLDDCLVYLDEAHTRGIDLKLPENARGALTLALGQTKDHTVQAAMRLRQLATTQSVCFFAFPETHQSILDVCGRSSDHKIDSSNVVRWLLEQTCRTNEQLQNLYISQGTDFCNRVNTEWENAAFLFDAQDRSAFVKVLRHPEQQTLEQLYGSRTENVHSTLPPTTTFPQLEAFRNKLNQLRLSMSQAADNLHSSALEEVEQEREVEFQVEEVREVQKAVHYEAHTFPGLHAAISGFVNTGRLCGNVGYESVSNAVSRTSTGDRSGIGGIESGLFVSAEFMRTIKTKERGLIDNFLRPVEWILYNPITSDALIVIAEEAEAVIPQLRTQSFPHKVHLLTYSAPVTKKMLPFSGLRYYTAPALPREHTIPPSLVIELGLFAGRLYMGYEECVSLVKYIDDVSASSRSNVTTTEKTRFILEWTSLRRKGQDVMHTPLGYVCQGRPLGIEHAFFVTRHAADSGVMKPYHTSEAVTEAPDDDEDEGEDEGERQYDGQEG
ncbi:unnamed protein product [Alternaria alternata]